METLVCVNWMECRIMMVAIAIIITIVVVRVNMNSGKT